MSHAVQEPNFTQQFVLHRYWQQCQCVPRTKLREYEVTREVVRANEQLIMSMRWVSARVFIITAIKLSSSDRSLTIVGASITSTILLRDLDFLAYSSLRFHTQYAKFLQFGIRTINLLLLLLCARLPTRHHQQDKNFSTWIYAWSAWKSFRLAYLHISISRRSSCALYLFAHYLVELAVLQVLLDSRSASSGAHKTRYLRSRCDSLRRHQYLFTYAPSYLAKVGVPCAPVLQQRTYRTDSISKSCRRDTDVHSTYMPPITSATYTHASSIITSTFYATYGFIRFSSFYNN